MSLCEKEELSLPLQRAIQPSTTILPFQYPKSSLSVSLDHPIPSKEGSSPPDDVSTRQSLPLKNLHTSFLNQFLNLSIDSKEKAYL